MIADPEDWRGKALAWNDKNIELAARLAAAEKVIEAARRYRARYGPLAAAGEETTVGVDLDAALAGYEKAYTSVPVSPNGPCTHPLSHATIDPCPDCGFSDARPGQHE